MLVKLIDHKGKTRYVNPIYIKSVDAKGDGETEISVSGWSSKVRIKKPVDEVALAVNAAMPDAAAYIAAQEDQKAAEEAAAAATVVIG